LSLRATEHQQQKEERGERRGELLFHKFDPFKLKGDGTIRLREGKAKIPPRDTNQNRIEFGLIRVSLAWK
jgi:hypothetical protein